MRQMSCELPVRLQHQTQYISAEPKTQTVVKAPAAAESARGLFLSNAVRRLTPCDLTPPRCMPQLNLL